MGFPKQEYWRGVGSHSLLEGNLPNARIEPVSLVSLALAGGFFNCCVTWEQPWKFVIHFQIRSFVHSPNKILLSAVMCQTMP